ncbi:MAG: hypothetical protein NWP98_10430 [Erythrobacter sp.]|nr:hypothetical protein [Erythrobacter sp.]
MKTPALFAPLAALGSAALLLTACGSSDDASTEASADTVEMPADTALTAIEEEPVADPAAAATDAPETATAAEAEAGAEQAADAAANVAAEAAAAAEKPSE